jgi:hypothetical protein
MGPTALVIDLSARSGTDWLEHESEPLRRYALSPAVSPATQWPLTTMPLGRSQMDSVGGRAGEGGDPLGGLPVPHFNKVRFEQQCAQPAQRCDVVV